MTFDEYWTDRVNHACALMGSGWQGFTGDERAEALLAWDAATKAAQAWRPMESAPKDGTSILAISEDGEPSVVCWNQVKCQWSGLCGGYFVRNEYFAFIHPSPVGWLPLPEPMEVK
jgi:hypothetical protein